MRKDIQDRYFPNTDRCPRDGDPCWGNKCKQFLEPKNCWFREFEEIRQKVFKTDESYIRYEDKDGSLVGGLEHISAELVQYISEKDPRETGEQRLIIEICFNSRRLTKGIKKKFNLEKWSIESRCMDGGDDHQLTLVIPGNYQNREEIEKTLRTVEELVPSMIDFEKEFNVCRVCGEKKDYLTEYNEDRIAICWGCEKDIISKHVNDYVKG